MSAYAVVVRAPTQAAPQPFRPIAELRCETCRDTCLQEGAIFAIVGADLRAWCRPACAAAAGIAPWCRH
jgi:hypothetical protein